MLLRRSRGYVPRVIPLAHPVSRPILAVGAHLKNTFCLAAGDAAILGPHIGDLETAAAADSLAEGAERMQRFLGVRAALVAHDLHPDYLSTSYARSLGLPLIAVQHHHAHVASALAEHGLDGPAIGLAFDGTGLGDDGALWGGEFLHRLGVRLRAGGDAAAAGARGRGAGGARGLADGPRAPRRRVRRRRAPAILERLALFDEVAPERIDFIRRMIAQRINAPPSHGMGRLFDAVGALILGRPQARYEGQVALEWNLAAGNESPPAANTGPRRLPAPALLERASALFSLDDSRTPWQLDLRPLVRVLVHEHLAGAPARALSALFHDTLAAACAATVHAVAARAGRLPVVLSGGCFQNARLAESVSAGLAPSFDVRLHHGVPPETAGSRWARRWSQTRARGGAHVALVSRERSLSISAEGRFTAHGRFLWRPREVRLDVVDEPVVPGDYILNHVGFAIRRIPASEIGVTLALYEELIAAPDENDLMAADVRGGDDGAGARGAMDSELAQLQVPRSARARRALRCAAPRVTKEIGRDAVAIMHVCGSHEQAIARFGLRATFPRGLSVIMGPGCPVCITDVPEVDEAVVLAQRECASPPTATCSGSPARPVARRRAGARCARRRRLQRRAGGGAGASDATSQSCSSPRGSRRPPWQRPPCSSPSPPP